MVDRKEMQVPFVSASPSSLHVDSDLDERHLGLLERGSKLSTAHDHDVVLKESKRDHVYKLSGPASLDSSSKPISGKLSHGYPVSTSDRNLFSSTARDYDGLKEQCERAMHELQSLRRQHNETLRKCDQTVKESEYYRTQHRIAMTRLDAVAQEVGTSRLQYNEIFSEKQRLEQQVKSLQKFREEDRKEVSELRRQQQEAMNADKGPSEALNTLYVTTLQKYETIKEEYNALRDRYTDLLGSHSEAMSKLELARGELVRLKSQYDESAQERTMAVRERNGLKQQCTAAIRQWDTALRERNEYKDVLAKVQQQHEEAVKEVNQAMAVRIKASKDIKRVTEERNAAMQEYTLVMSERDTVHKEMERLSDDLTQANKKVKSLEIKIQENLEERKSLSYQVETLKREISSALRDRDRALKECSNLREKFGDISGKEDPQKKDSYKGWAEYNASRKRDSVQNESSGNLTSAHESCRERVDDLDQANQEIDRLRKQVEKLQGDMQETCQEAEVSKHRRDWAFNERDKVVLERESIRTLCDKLRRERDRAVTDLAEALRDSDDIKKQRNEASKKLKDLQEKLEAHLVKESRFNNLQSVNHNHSRDSAIDMDMQEWETETLEMEVSGSLEDNIGFELCGGQEEGGIYVSSITKGSVADGTLKVNDWILQVNQLDCASVDKQLVMEAIRSAQGRLIIVVRRRRLGGRFMYTTQIQVGVGQQVGLVLEREIRISQIIPGSIAAKEGGLAVGDRILSVNGRPLENFGSVQEVMMLLEDNDTHNLMVTVMKSSTTPSSSAPLSSSSSGHNMTEDERRHSPHVSSNSKDSLKRSRELTRSVGGNSSRSSGPWEKIREKARGKRNSKDRISIPYTISFDREKEDALAQLDSVIGSYHDKKSRRRERGTTEGRGMGTWPKCRTGVTNLPNDTASKVGTLVCKHKDRPPIPYVWGHQDIGPLLVSTPSPSLQEYSCPSYTLCKSYDGNVFSHLSAKSDDPHLSTASIDLSVKSGNMGKEVLEYYVKKNRSKSSQSDSESNVSPTGHQSHHSYVHYISPSMVQSPLSLPHYPPFLPHPHHIASTSFPLTLPASQSGECFLSSFDGYPVQSYSPSPSVELSGAQSQHHGNDEMYYERGTFPRKKEHGRIRIPSNQSVTSKSSTGHISTSSFERERGSPTSSFQVELLSPGRSKFINCKWPKKPAPGEVRRVHIDKSCEPLGIQISCLENGGVFVSSVTENSLAAQVGLQVGDQLLEVCGINLRSATYELAASVLRQCGDTITMLVQYSPGKLDDAVSTSSGEGSSSSDIENNVSSEDEPHSGSPTPCNSPKAAPRNSTDLMAPGSATHGNPSRHEISQAVGTLSRQSTISEKMSVSQAATSMDPRYTLLEAKNASNLGISLVGGNAVGIFIHSVQPDSPAHHAGLRTGDQILEYNGTNLRQATAEVAAYELAKPVDKVTILAQLCVERYNKIKDQPGDGFFVRTLFERLLEDGVDAIQLRFRKDDILFVDNTMFNGVPGHWRAWQLDQEGEKRQWGIIPSKYKVEEELMLKRIGGDLDVEGSRRGAILARRSFFRRKKSHQHRSSSRDSKELASFSDVSINTYSDCISYPEEAPLCSYQRVQRFDSLVLDTIFRPVVIVGPMAECVVDRLVQDFPHKFARCVPELLRCPPTKVLADHILLEFRRKGNNFEAITITTVKQIAEKQLHCLLEVGLGAVEKLHRHQLFPIVLLVKFKSPKQIREVKDSRCYVEKVSAKAAKEMYEHSLKIEAEYQHLISLVIPAGVNIAYMCTQIKAAVDTEQSKTLWVPAPGPLSGPF